MKADGRSTARREPDSLHDILGGPRSAVDASLPPLAFGLGWFASQESIAVGGAAAVLVSLVIAFWRWRSSARPFAVVLSLLAVMLGVVIALRTGNAADFFLVRLASNAASALVWMASITVRWPILGVIVGGVLRQGKAWRGDPALLGAYQRASWVWVGQYVTRLVVFVPLWQADAVAALTTVQAVLTWPLVALTVAVSWWVLRKSLPATHPGIRHPVRE